MRDRDVPKQIRDLWRPLTRRQRWLLTELRDHLEDDAASDDYRGEVVLDGGRGFCGWEPISRRTVDALSSMCALHLTSEHNDFQRRGVLERYEINEIGRHLLAREASKKTKKARRR